MHRRLPLFLSLLAVFLASPALWTGWQLDDLYHRWILLGHPVGEGLLWSGWELFTFLDGEAARTRHLMDLGLLPWWTLEDIRLAFWRPLAVLTHRVDYLLWPMSAAAMHVHSLLWFGAVVAAATVFYRRIFGGYGVAGLAALFFAVDDAHALPASWIANRNALLGTFFGLACLVAHHHWRSKGSACSDRRRHSGLSRTFSRTNSFSGRDPCRSGRRPWCRTALPPLSGWPPTTPGGTGHGVPDTTCTPSSSP